MTPDPIPISREHKKLGDELDDIYIEAVNAASYARGYLRQRRGNFGAVFFQFYYPFDALFQHTRYLPDMKDADEDLIADIEQWVQTEEKPKISQLRRGLDLFSEYQKAVIKGGAVVLKRV